MAKKVVMINEKDWLDLPLKLSEEIWKKFEKFGYVLILNEKDGHKAIMNKMAIMGFFSTILSNLLEKEVS